MDMKEALALAERARERHHDRLIFREQCREAFELVVWQSDLPSLIESQDATAIGMKFLRALQLAKQPPADFDPELPEAKPRLSDEELERISFDRRVL